MNAMLKILCRVVCRRIVQGENLEEILTEYSRLSAEERELVIQKAVGQ